MSIREGDYVVRSTGDVVRVISTPCNDDDHIGVIWPNDNWAVINVCDVRPATEAEKIRWCDERISVGQKLKNDGERRKEQILMPLYD